MAGFDPPAVWIRRTGETSGGTDGSGPPRRAADRARVAGDQAAALLAEVTGGPVERDGAGRPFLPGGGPHVSISHHAGRIAVAASTAGPVGVDIETIRDVPADALAERWFHPAETAWLAGLDSDVRSVAFLRLWTLKEAVGKALGIGLAGGRVLRNTGPLLGAETDEPGVLLPIAGVPGMCGTALVHGDLVVGVACRAASTAGQAVTLRS